MTRATAAPAPASQHPARPPTARTEARRRTEVYAGTGTGERFGRQDFVARVSERAGVEEPQAAYIIRAVTEVADEAVQGGLMAKVAESLPTDIHQLTAAGSTG